MLDAALHLLGQQPLRDLTVEAIAQHAGVGKATIYKWWPSKAHVALTAFLARMEQAVETPDTGSAKGDFLYQLTTLIDFYGGPLGHVFRQFIAEAQADPAFAATYRERFLEPRRAAVRAIWRRGVERGEIDPRWDAELVLDLIYAPLVYRVLAGHARFTPADAERLVEAVFRGIGSGSHEDPPNRVSP